MKRLASVLAALLATAAPGVAQARVVFLNFFGSSNGFTVSGVLNYDTNLAASSRYDYNGYSSAYYYPGGTTPISINGVGYTMSNSYLYAQDAFAAGNSDQFSAYGSSYNGSTSASFSLSITDGLSMLSSTALPTSLFGGTGSLNTYISSGSFSQSTTLPISFSLSTTGAVSSVPEPASWLVMTLGVAGMGVMMRRRRAATVRVAYA
jgi:hypothetical protein